MDDKDDLNELLNKYNIDKYKYFNSISNNYYNRDNVIQNDYILDLLCPICYNIVKNPKFCSSNKNSHPFCKECIDKYLEENDKCPICKNNFENITKNEFENLLHKLEFKCLFFKEGCTKIINYLEYFVHINKCKYNNLIYKCQINKYNYSNKEFQECNYEGNIEEINNHFKRCAFIKYNAYFVMKIYYKLT